ncbi:RagB/SusD family nutrient uptake outer membrane protein [Desertivirga xinjiangensis]|uniref:RagB/SusD family nutrient uptake outer membrane protein n=1 Tax=Desertivirga xinjiangensis TaxID=539206 RepID=UPI00210C8C58|nr:RagB/SusD family nutrient uptake outer membrane protein [Pedobacter xinjiangensis]
MKRLVFTFMMFGLVTGCSLDEVPSSFVNTGNYYQTESQLVTGLNSCYIPLRSIYNYTYLIATEGITDLMWIASGTLDAQLDISPAQPRFGQTMWTQGYRGVMYCNSIIEAIKRAPVEEEVKNRLLAEGMVMRAYYYWFLTCTFGDVPFYTEDIVNVEVLERVSKLGRMDAVGTRNYLIEELIRYVPHLPQVRTNDVAGNRSGAAMGWMMIGKLAQWNKRWDVARDAMDKLEAIYGDLSQYPLTDIMLKNKNIRESIFEIQYLYDATGLQVTTNSAAICMPPRNSGSTYDGVNIPELGANATTWTPLRPTNYFFQSLQRRNSADLRTTLNMAWEYNGQAFRTATNVPWPGPKFWSFNMFNVADGNNQRVFRYADALLMQAENYLELGNTTRSVEYLDKVRQRAGTGSYTFRNREALLDEIQRERGRELLGEYQRKYDMVRWGNWYQMTYDYTDYATVKNRILPCHEYYPIPDMEVVKSDYNLDNKAYEAYGK